MTNDIREKAGAVIKNNRRIIKEMQPLKESGPWMGNLELCFLDNTHIIEDLKKELTGEHL